ncbi:UDP-glucose 4-epimerase GalE [Magnetococcales bacterium HHB-1]
MGEQTILVTGGAGYIGSHACKALAQAGYHPVVYDNLVNGHAWAVKWGPLEQGDLLDSERLEAVIQRYQPQAVLHFAGLIEVGESVKDPGIFFQTNSCGTLSLLRALHKYQINKCIFSSTAAVYGSPEVVPIQEHAPIRPINPYGVSKQMAEQLLESFHQVHGLRYAALRYFNVAGADPDGEVGESHHPETHLIPLILQAVAGLRPEITIFGDDYNTPDGTCIRDYIHVSDLVDAHILALEQLSGAQPKIVMNLGNGEGFSVREVIEATQRVVGKKVPIRQGERRPGDPDRLLADASLAKQVLGWRPQFESLEPIIETAWRWLQKSK